jgi:pimeloyl-ACP methyl ester carboxylesterase
LWNRRGRPAHRGARAGGLWLGGFKSDMRGTKAAALDAWAEQNGRACTRFDYSGHGESGGSFVDGTIGRWLEESLAVFTQCCPGPQVVIGSSMGGWIALLLARALRQRRVQSHLSTHPRASGDPASVESPLRGNEQGNQDPSLAALVLIAPAVDFTEALMWNRFPAKVKRQIEKDGFWERPSAYGDGPYPITRNLIEEGRNHLMLGGLIETGCPVRILQGVQDPDVPFAHAMELVTHLAHDDVVITLVKDGDHRLSRPEDLERLTAAVAEFC